MPASSQHVYSSRSLAIFAELARDLEAGVELDIESACGAHPELEAELRALHANWSRLNGVLDRIAVDRGGDELSDAAARELSPADALTRRTLERLSSAGSRYAVLEEIARGGMGVVLRVHDEHLERDLAMKLVRDGDAPTPAGGWRRLARFLAEARLAGKLDHPGIVPIHDVGVDARGRAYFTMPLVRGRRLTEVIDLVHAGREGWTEARALEVMLKVCDTVAYAHSVGVVHRDLKPDNIMIGRFGETYVMDWGLARVLARSSSESADASALAAGDVEATAASAPAAGDHPTRDGDVLGTPAYMAPEQAVARRSETSPQADVYSVGAILYHLLAGRAPYSFARGERAAGDVLDAVRGGPPAALERLAPRASAELVAICEKAMARSRDLRYADMHAMSQDLRAYMEGRVVRAHGAGAVAELKKWVTRNRRLALAIGVALLLAIGGPAAVLYVQTTSKNELLKLSDQRRIETLVRQADWLWPAVPEKSDAMVAWLKDADAVLENREHHERMLREMLERNEGSSDARSAAAGRASNEDQWQLENQSRLVADFDRLADPDPRRGLIANVKARLDVASGLRAATIDGPAAEWRAAVESIADERECPMYRGLVIAPQMGLIPIGRDAHSQLWEFAHLQSGAPARRAADGTLSIDAENGIVLVLVPGGVSTIGSRPPKPGQPADVATDPLARREELPARTLEIAPFLVSKYELSAAQWARLCAFAGADDCGGGRPQAEALHPARGLAWLAATRVLERMGLVLPTEAQWEHAARAGTSTRWWCGNEPRLLIDAANVGSGIDGSLPYADAFEETAPIDALRPNPWGLHHVLGNVCEWTQDPYWPNHEAKLRVPDGLALVADDGLRAARGGSYASSAANARCASRAGFAPGNHDREIGLRAARPIDR